jgi:hypothetical protein
MVDLRGLQAVRHFQKSGDLEPLMKIFKAGALSPTVQRMIANDQGTKQKGTFYLAAKRHRGEHGRPLRLLEAGQQIREWMEQGHALKWALSKALEQKLITNDTQGKEAVKMYNEAMEFLAQQAAEESE